MILVAILFGKIFATSVSLGAGASGGVFSPSLFIGATLGAAVGALGNLIFPGSGFSVIEFAVVGMGAVVGGATGASMTAIVMIFEMTRDYHVIVPLVLAVALATGVRRALIAENIYTIKLRGRGRPIPTIRHTNMYLVRQARELMNKDFIVLPIDTPIADALAAIAERPEAHIIVVRRRPHRRRGAGSRPIPTCPTAMPGRRSAPSPTTRSSSARTPASSIRSSPA